MNPEQLQNTDHDLIVEIKTELKLFREESRSINNDTKERLIMLGANKLEKDTFNAFIIDDAKFKSDHERRMRRVEGWGLVAIGGGYILQIIIGWYLLYHK